LASVIVYFDGKRALCDRSIALPKSSASTRKNALSNFRLNEVDCSLKEVDARAIKIGGIGVPNFPFLHFEVIVHGILSSSLRQSGRLSRAVNERQIANPLTEDGGAASFMVPG
jgi:hypothetical protein